MKAHLIDTHLLVPGPSAKVKVKYQGHISQKMGVSGALVFQNTSWFFYKIPYLLSDTGKLEYHTASGNDEDKGADEDKQHQSKYKISCDSNVKGMRFELYGSMKIWSSIS